ncbi:MAG: hypothetical protein GXO43_04945, partial [Crenarchaeota archaeon]|nr:hypothetical protein [Thermoproteota archaeon]
GYSVMTIHDHILKAETNLDLEKLEMPRWKVVGFNEIIYGLKPWGMPPWHKIPSTLKLPMKIKDLPEITMTVQYTINRTNTGLDLAYDIWIKQENKTDGVHPGDVEIMIWLYHEHVHPAGRQVATITLPTKINGTITDTKWQIWIYPHMGTGWLYIAYVIENPIRKGEVTVNLTKILSYTAKLVQQILGEKLGEMYMMSIELGTEIFYNKQIHVEWTMTKYIISIKHHKMETSSKTTTSTLSPTTSTTSTTCRTTHHINQSLTQEANNQYPENTGTIYITTTHNRASTFTIAAITSLIIIIILLVFVIRRGRKT